MLQRLFEISPIKVGLAMTAFQAGGLVLELDIIHLVVMIITGVVTILWITLRIVKFIRDWHDKGGD